MTTILSTDSHGQMFEKAVLKWAPEEVRAMIATLDVVTLGSGLAAKLKEVFSEETAISLIQKEIEEKTKEYTELGIHELSDVLVARLKQRSSCSNTSIDADEILSTVFYDIAAEYDVLLYKHYSAQTVAIKVMTAVLDEMFQQIYDEWEKMPEDKQREFAAAVHEGINELTDADKAEVVKALKLEDVSIDGVFRALRRGALVGLGILLARGKGFAVYMAANIIIRAVFRTLLGLAVPFVVYQSAARVISILLGPVGWLLAGVLTIIDLRKESRKFNAKLMGALLVQLYLPVMPKESVDSN